MLTKGRHYSLTVYYLGGAPVDQPGLSHCALYDVTLAISHLTKVKEETECRAGTHAEPLGSGLTHVITDRDLDGDGAYSFDKVLRLQYPEDFKKVAKTREDGKPADILAERIVFDLSSNFDIRASLDWEYDQALFTLGFTEAVRDESGEWYADASHEQSPLIFKQNNDHFQTVRRELVADGVESQEHSRKHTLTIANRQPGLLGVLGGPAGAACLYVRVKISLQATQRSAQGLYSSSRRRSGGAPTLQACRPDESPAFVHGRPSSAHFDLVFNTRPYVQHHDALERQDERALAEALRLKASTVSLADGSTSEVHLAPSAVTGSSKAYRGDEYHVAVAFDLTEFERTATEKLVHAQLVVLTAQLVDSDGVTFGVEARLAARGLPIYVYEQNDEEQLL